MTKKAVRADRATGAALGFVKATSPDRSENSRPLPEIQCDFLAARFGLSAERARLVAGLAFGESRT